MRKHWLVHKASDSEKSNDKKKRPWNNKNDKSDSKKFKPGSSSESKSEQKVESKNCKVCDGTHAVHKCEKFRKMNITERKKSAREHNLCYNCLHPSHSSRDCKSDGCKRCDNKKHNSLLCSENPQNRAVNVVQQSR